MDVQLFLTGLVPDTSVALQLGRFLITFVIGVLFTRLLLMPLTRRAARKRSADKKSQHSLQNLVGVATLFLVFIISLQAASFGGLTTVIGAMAAAATVAFGFGMRDQVSNVVAGIFIHLDNPFVKNDYIKVNDTEGVVREIRLHATTINGEKGEKTILPNGMLTQNPVRNFTKGSQTKTSLELEVKPEKFEDASEKVTEIAEANKRVLEKPSPSTGLERYEGRKAVLEAEYWVRDSENVSEVRDEILKEFNKSATEFFPEE